MLERQAFNLDDLGSSPNTSTKAGMAKVVNALDLESRNWEFESLFLYKYSTSPNGRGNSLKRCKVLVRIQGRVQISLWCNGKHTRLRTLEYGFKSY